MGQGNCFDASFMACCRTQNNAGEVVVVSSLINSFIVFIKEKLTNATYDKNKEYI